MNSVIFATHLSAQNRRITHFLKTPYNFCLRVAPALLCIKITVFSLVRKKHEKLRLSCLESHEAMQQYS